MDHATRCPSLAARAAAIRLIASPPPNTHGYCYPPLPTSGGYTLPIFQQGREKTTLNLPGRSCKDAGVLAHGPTKAGENTHGYTISNYICVYIHI